MNFEKDSPLLHFLCTDLKKHPTPGVEVVTDISYDLCSSLWSVWSSLFKFGQVKSSLVKFGEGGVEKQFFRIPFDQHIAATGFPLANCSTERILLGAKRGHSE